MQNRRSFLAGCAFAAATAGTRAVSTEVAGTANRICVFTKPFNSLSFEQLASQTAAIGFDGIEAPIRSGGHIEPEAVSDELPKLVAALHRHKKAITVLTSDINDASSLVDQNVLKTAASLGIRYYRMKYFKYDESRPVRLQINEWKAKLRDLAALNRELGITAVYQNHAGRNYFGAPLWDLVSALEDIDPEAVGVAYDIRHATAEAGLSWPISFRLIRPHIRVVYVKDFIWGESKPVNVPLGQGRVQKEFFRMLMATDFGGPISLHEEYLDHRKAELVDAHWSAIEKDFDTLKSLLQKA